MDTLLAPARAVGCSATVPTLCTHGAPSRFRRLSDIVPCSTPNTSVHYPYAGCASLIARIHQAYCRLLNYPGAIQTILSSMSMAQEPKGAPQLDQLEAMVNLVVRSIARPSRRLYLTISQLEQTGRIYRHGAKGRSDSALAHAHRLKQTLPNTLSTFHDALDDLQTDLVRSVALPIRLPATYTC